MSELILVKPNETHVDEIFAYRQEFIADSDMIHGSSGLERFDSLTKVLEWVSCCRLFEKKETLLDPKFVTASQFLLMREGESAILGMINLRHCLNDYLYEYGGHIGYSVRPTERRKGYAKAMLMLCLEECRNLGLDRVLITCDDDNEGSFKTIEACGGKFDRMAKKKASESSDATD